MGAAAETGGTTLTPSSGERPLPVRRVLALALLTAMALALAAAESLLPLFIPFPGVKLGLPNIVALAAFALVPRKQVFLIVAMRLALAGLVLGTFLTPAFWISCGGGLLSFLAMAALSGSGAVSVVGVSLAGAAAHNAGQLLVVALLLGSGGMAYYLPWLLLWSVPTGFFTGFSAQVAISALRKTGISGKL